ncbi:MAG: hypothetical protein BWX68_03031 [Verrucomicrobia bacterium ADurb.Bin063]|nr:MAG: hypothetical protein BWX68_03031 [Verrucomicrobia bacterium ADurb.Bin063]
MTGQSFSATPISWQGAARTARSFGDAPRQSSSSPIGRKESMLEKGLPPSKKKGDDAMTPAVVRSPFISASSAARSAGQASRRFFS